MNRLWGINQTKLKETLDALDPQWWSDLAATMSQELDSLHSVGKLRDNISHGGDNGVGIPQVKQYRDDIFRLFNHLSQLLEP